MREMEGSTFWTHLEAFRMLMIRLLVCLCIAFLAWMVVVPHLFDTVILGPCQADFPIYRLLRKGTLVCGLTMGEDEGMFPIRLINIKLGSQFFIHLQVSLALSILTLFPVAAAEVWRFLRSGLYDNEQRSVGRVLMVFPLLFYLGCLVGYFLVFPLSLRFLLFYDLGELIDSGLSLESYMSQFFTLIFSMGIVFLLPLVVQLLSWLGVLTRDTYSRVRRYAIVALLILSAVITPGGDPITMLVVFLPLYLLYEISVLFVRKTPIRHSS